MRSKIFLATSDLTPEERRIYAGKAGRDIESIGSDIFNGVSSEQHLRVVERFSNDFYSAATFTITDSVMSLVMSSDLTGAQFPSLEIAGLNASYVNQGRSSQDFITFNRFVSHVSRDLLAIQSRPFPLLWGVTHTNERLDERSFHGLDFSEPRFFNLLALSLTMNRIIDENTDWERVRFVPFVLPVSDGLFLGAAERCDESKFGNRAVAITFNEQSKDSVGLYSWRPQVEMRVHTFVGLRNLNRHQTKLKNTLIAYLGGKKADGLRLELMNYGHIEGKDFNGEQPEMIIILTLIFL